jgi:hypothetical protein
MAAIARISARSMFLHKGNLLFCGAPEKTVQHYLSTIKPQDSKTIDNGIKLINCIFSVPFQDGSYVLQTGQSLQLEIELCSEVEKKNTLLLIHIHTRVGDFVAEYSSDYNMNHLAIKMGYQNIHVSIDSIQLNPGVYDISLIIMSEDHLEHLLWNYKGWSLKLDGDRYGSGPYQLKGLVTN